MVIYYPIGIWYIVHISVSALYSLSCCFVLVLRVAFCDVFFFQAEDGRRDLVRSRGLGDVYKRQSLADLMRGG